MDEQTATTSSTPTSLHAEATRECLIVVLATVDINVRSGG